MLERQREGIAKAKAAGKYKGRPVSIDTAQIRRRRAGLGPAAIAKRLGSPEFGLPRARIGGANRRAFSR
jgi:DNA invertase Pin-like site-specific DNA recombinase